MVLRDSGKFLKCPNLYLVLIGNNIYIPNIPLLSFTDWFHLFIYTRASCAEKSDCQHDQGSICNTRINRQEIF